MVEGTQENADEIGSSVELKYKDGEMGNILFVKQEMETGEVRIFARDISGREVPCLELSLEGACILIKAQKEKALDWSYINNPAIVDTVEDTTGEITPYGQVRLAELQVHNEA